MYTQTAGDAPPADSPKKGIIVKKKARKRPLPEQSGYAEKLERDERMDISRSITPPKTWQGGFTAPKPFKIFDNFPGGKYAAQGKRYPPPPDIAYEPHTVYILESRAVAYGIGELDKDFHDMDACHPSEFELRVRRKNRLMPGEPIPPPGSMSEPLVKLEDMNKRTRRMKRKVEALEREEEVVWVRKEGEPDEQALYALLTPEDIAELEAQEETEGGETTADVPSSSSPSHPEPSLPPPPLRPTTTASANPTSPIPMNNPDPDPTSNPITPKIHAPPFPMPPLSRSIHSSAIDRGRDARRDKDTPDASAGARRDKPDASAKRDKPVAGGTKGKEKEPLPHQLEPPPHLIMDRKPRDLKRGGGEGVGMRMRRRWDDEEDGEEEDGKALRDRRMGRVRAAPERRDEDGMRKPGMREDGRMERVRSPWMSQKEIEERDEEEDEGAKEDFITLPDNQASRVQAEEREDVPVPRVRRRGEDRLRVSRKQAEERERERDEDEDDEEGWSTITSPPPPPPRPKFVADLPPPENRHGLLIPPKLAPYIKITTRAPKIKPPELTIKEFDKVKQIIRRLRKKALDIRLEAEKQRRLSNPKPVKKLDPTKSYPVPFWRPLLTVDLATRPLADVFSRLQKMGNERGTAYHAVMSKFSPGEHIPKTSFAVRMRCLKVRRTVEVARSFAELLCGARGGIVGFRLNAGMKGRGVDGLEEGVPWEYRIVKFGVGVWYEGARDVREMIEDAGREVVRRWCGEGETRNVFEVFYVDEWGRRVEDPEDVHGVGEGVRPFYEGVPGWVVRRADVVREEDEGWWGLEEKEDERKVTLKKEKERMAREAMERESQLITHVE